MKKFKFAFLATALVASSFLVSCSDDDDPVVETNNSASLTAGRSGIVFNTNTNFVSSTAFNVRNTATTSASSNVSGSTRTINLIATEVNGTATRTATISISLPETSSTTTGNITSDLSIPLGSTVVASVMLTSSTGSTLGTTYNSNAGTLTITKLTNTEIEGTFNGNLDDSGTNAIVITNGTFAGKFM